MELDLVLQALEEKKRILFILITLFYHHCIFFLWEDKLFFKDTHIKLKDGRLVHICPRNSYYSIYSGIFVF